MEKKILFFDIDGTLLNFEGEMPDSTRETLRRAKENGHSIVICSGRATYQIMPWLQDLSDGLIASTGAYVRVGNNIIYEKILPREILDRVHQVLAASGSMVWWQSEERLFLTEDSLVRSIERFRRLGKPESTIQRIFGNASVLEDYKDYTGVKKAVYFESKKTVEEIRLLLEDCCDVTPASFGRDVSGSGEITLRGINKSLGMAKYLEAIGCARESSIAFGDGANDLDMLAFAEIGVAMGNAREEVKVKADFVTLDVNEGGISYALEMLGLIK